MEKARVLLLNPPTAAESTEILLSLAYLASSLRVNGHEAKVIDATAPYHRYTPKMIKEAIAEFKPHFIGITLTISHITDTYEFMRDLRKEGVPIVAGGAHANPLPEEVLASGADIVVLGEGESTIVELAEHFRGSGKRLDEILGLCVKNPDGSNYRTPARPLIENLDELPFPSFEDFPIRYYTGSDDVDSNPIFWSIFSSRGCPFNCIFCCGHNVFGRTYRMRSAKNIFDEIKSLVDKFGVKKITFQDDEILISKKRIMELCDLIEAGGLDLKMSVRARIDSIDEELLRRMKSVGFNRISFGIESWCNQTLEMINKKYTQEIIKEKFKIIARVGFPYVSFNNIVGFPFEARKNYMDTLSAIRTIPRSITYFTNAVTPIPYPNTKLYDTYHAQYGFTGWWLDPAKHKDRYYSTATKPLFLNFTKGLFTLYVKEPFWSYSKKSRRDIEDFTWGIFKLSIERRLPVSHYLILSTLCQMSHWLWRRSPRLEKLVFGWLPEGFLLDMQKKIYFTHME